MSYLRPPEKGYTRMMTDIGRPENVERITASKTGQIKGYPSIPTINRDFDEVHTRLEGHKGGHRPYGFKPDHTLPLGTGAGGPFISVERTNDCGGVVADTNLNTSIVETPLLQGGGKSMCKNVKICNDVKEIHDFSQVKRFWSVICPGAINVYKNYISMITNKQDKKRQFLQEYTRAFCFECDALKSKNKKVIRVKRMNMEKKFKRVRELTKKLVSSSVFKKMEKDLDRIKKMHLKRVDKHKDTIKSNKRTRKGGNKKNKTRRRGQTKKNQKGGSNPAWSNKAYSSTMVAPSSPMFPRQSHLGTIPHTRDTIVDCRDNYNHYLNNV